MAKDDEFTERRKHTPESVMKELQQCQTEVGIQIEALRGELKDHKDSFDIFKRDFAELLEIFRNAKGFFAVVSWVGKAVRWLVLTGVAIGTIWAALKSGNWK